MDIIVLILKPPLISFKGGLFFRDNELVLYINTINTHFFETQYNNLFSFPYI
jgi:hypothetical protein